MWGNWRQVARASMVNGSDCIGYVGTGSLWRSFSYWYIGFLLLRSGFWQLPFRNTGFIFRASAWSSIWASAPWTTEIEGSRTLSESAELLCSQHYLQYINTELWARRAWRVELLSCIYEPFTIKNSIRIDETNITISVYSAEHQGQKFKKTYKQS